jgi:hypothetical protein
MWKDALQKEPQMSDKLEELKRQQEAIAQKIKLEELKNERESIQQQINDLTFADGKAATHTNPESKLIKQETYKGKVIAMEEGKYKVNGVIQKFSSIDDAKIYIDSTGTLFDRNDEKINKNNDGPVLKFMLVLALGIAVFIIYNAINLKSPESSKTQLKIPVVSAKNKHDDISLVEKAGICQGYHIFWSALSARNNNQRNVRCSVSQVEQLNNKYGQSPIFKENRESATKHLLRAFENNDVKPGLTAQEICIEAGVSICNID